MQEKDLSIINIKHDYQQYQSIWADCLTYIEQHCKKDSLYENYLSIDVTNFLCFHAAIYDETIIAFGGVEQKPDRWGDNVVRALTRFWMHPEFRTKGLTKWNDKTIRFSPIILKAQLEYLSNHGEGKTVIITREGRYLNSFREIVRLANSVSNKDFTVMPDRYNVCKPQDPPPATCVQFIAINNVDEFFRAQRLGFFKTYG